MVENLKENSMSAETGETDVYDSNCIMSTTQPSSTTKEELSGNIDADNNDETENDKEFRLNEEWPASSSRNDNLDSSCTPFAVVQIGNENEVHVSLSGNNGLETTSNASEVPGHDSQGGNACVVPVAQHGSDNSVHIHEESYQTSRKDGKVTKVTASHSEFSEDDVHTALQGAGINGTTPEQRQSLTRFLNNLRTAVIVKVSIRNENAETQRKLEDQMCEDLSEPDKVSEIAEFARRQDVSFHQWNKGCIEVLLVARSKKEAEVLKRKLLGGQLDKELRHLLITEKVQRLANYEYIDMEIDVIDDAVQRRPSGEMEDGSEASIRSVTYRCHDPACKRRSSKELGSESTVCVGYETKDFIPHIELEDVKECFKQAGIEAGQNELKKFAELLTQERQEPYINGDENSQARSDAADVNLRLNCGVIRKKKTDNTSVTRSQNRASAEGLAS